MNQAHIYGIKNCNTMKKAMAWLDEHQITYVFHDYKKESIETIKLDEWLRQETWDVLINRRGTTWRKLEDSDKENIDNDKAIKLMRANNSLIKRPVIEVEGKITLGFKEEEYSNLFSI